MSGIRLPFLVLIVSLLLPLVAGSTTVDLKVRELDRGKVQTLEKVAMTLENRKAILKARLDREGKADAPLVIAPEIKRVQRAHAADVPERFRFLQTRFAPRPPYARRTFPKLSPFAAIRWKESTPEVQVKETWYELLAIDDLEATKIVGFCQRIYGDQWQKRFEEDLVEVLVKMGHKLGGQDHFQLDRRQAEEDLDQLEWHLEQHYSYRTLNPVDYRGALDAVRVGLGEAIPCDVFAVQVAKVLALFGDGHTRVRGLRDVVPDGYAPFIVGQAEGRFVAIRPDGAVFLDSDRPYLSAIDGLAMEKWIEAAARLGPGGSPQSVRRHALENMGYLQYVRSELGHERKKTVSLKLESADGKDTHTLTLPVAIRLPDGDIREKKHPAVEGNIGYLRIDRMDDDPGYLKELTDTMKRFRDTKGLIIDVRDNGGGTREVLRVLFPFFMKEGDPPRIVNVAAYRLDEGDKPDVKDGFLQDRFLYPVTSDVWSEKDREALRSFAAIFKPEWAPPANQFSAWHYFLLKPRSGEGYYHYDRPVVILLNAGCFSATDIFLGAFKGWRNVTLLGTTSGGGSGRPQGFALRHSDVQLYLSSIVSFQPNGKFYDGRGVSPDVEMEPRATDLIGQTDTILDAAAKRLR